MNVLDKLRLIQEGYSINDIASGNIEPFAPIVESSLDDITLFTEGFSVDIAYATQMSLNMLQESDSDKKGILKRFIDWLIGKIRQFKTFIMNMFKKKHQEITAINNTKLKKLLNTDFKPFMISGNFNRVVNDPTGAIASLKELVSKFEDINADYVDETYKGVGYTGDIKEHTDMNGVQIIIWKKALNNAPISYDKNVTANVIDHVLEKSAAVRIQSKDQIQNILTFTENFYDLWRDMHQALGYYEGQLTNLSVMADDGFKVVQLLCETMLHTYPQILAYINGHLTKMTMIEKYI